MADSTANKIPSSSNSSTSPGGGTIAVLGVVYFVLVGLVVWASYNFTDWTKTDRLRDFTALVVAGLTASSALMGLVVSVLTLRKNQESAAKIEAVKADLQTDVNNRKVWSDLRFEHEKMKTAAEAGAYAKLWTSIDSAYLKLAKLETGKWTTEDKTQMDSTLLEARGQLIYMRNAEHQTMWEKARQRARDISERASQVAATKQHDLWTENVAEFSSICSQFKQVANEEIHRPPPSLPQA